METRYEGKTLLEIVERALASAKRNSQPVVVVAFDVGDAEEIVGAEKARRTIEHLAESEAMGEAVDEASEPHRDFKFYSGALVAFEVGPGYRRAEWLMPYGGDRLRVDLDEEQERYFLDVAEKWVEYGDRPAEGTYETVEAWIAADACRKARLINDVMKDHKEGGK